MNIFHWAILFGVLEWCTGAKILGLLPMPSRSHGLLMESLMRELCRRGHHVTYIAAEKPSKGVPPNMTLVNVPNVYETFHPTDADGKNDGMDKMMFKGISSWFMFVFAFMGPSLSDNILKAPAVQDVINSKEKFDLVVGEIFLDESLLAGFSHKFNVPLVGVMSFLPNIWGNYLVGNPSQSSYIPESTLGIMPDMTFFERLYNFLFGLAWDFFHPWIYLNRQDAVMRKHFGDDLPPIQDILKDTSFVLVNHHHSLAFPRPYLPNMVEVGGYHIAPTKPLPEKLQKFMDESKQGVVFFSLGSNLKSANMPIEKRNAILKAFQRLPYNVLWKFEEEFENLPKNVRIDKWLPQSDLLAHPNLKLFITHGGMLSTTEAVHHGVPVLGIPIFGDQPLNMKLSEAAGFGRMLTFDEVTENKLYDMIMEVANNPRYRETAKLRSSVFKDEILPPMERAMWWIDYVLRHNGAKHLKSHAQKLWWFQLHQLDVIAVVLVGGLVLGAVNLFIVRALFRKMCGKSKVVKDGKKVKKN